MNARKSVNTLKCYADGWKKFSLWCVDAGQSSLPATAETLKLFIAWYIDQGARLETVKARLNAVPHYHAEAGFASPMDKSVRELLRNAARFLREKPAGKAAITPELLRSLCKKVDDGSLCGIRDRALFLLKFASGWRRSEIVSLDRRDVKWVPEGITVHLGASKTDQIGRGRVIGIPYGKRANTCPVRALKAWIQVRGAWEGPLFVRVRRYRHRPESPTAREEITREGIRGDAVHQALRRALRRIGEDPNPFGAHSLRAGMVTAAAERGASEFSIMARSGHRDIKTVQKYVRPATVFKMNPLAGVL